MTARSIIVLEANEIPFRVFDYFCQRRPGSAIAGLMKGSRQYLTRAEDCTKFIVPWTTWPSFHRGVHDEIHKILRLGQWEVGPSDKYPPIWSLLSRHGIRAGVFSSMQSSPLPTDSRDYAFYFPDMFSTASATEPPELRSLQEFNLAMTRESGRNVSRGIDLGRAARMLLDSPRLGIRARTYLDVCGQLVDELVNPYRKTRRRAYQPMIMLDAYFKLLKRTRPQFSTFFTNHVAAAMHRYWAAVFPEDYEDFDPDPVWVARYRGEIEFAMSKLDSIVKRLVNFVDCNDDFMLVLATSMGQAAIPARHVRQFLTITNVPVFLSALHLQPSQYEIRPAMVPDFSFKIAPGAVEEFEKALLSFDVEGKGLQIGRDDDFFHLGVYDERADLKQVRVLGKLYPLAEMGLGYVVHEDEVSATAQHIPEGVLLVYSPHSEVKTAPSSRLEVSALDFAPSVLRHFGIPVPKYMRSADLLANC